MRSMPRKRAYFVLAGLAAAVISCAHPSYRVTVQNESGAGGYVRLSAGEAFADSVYEAPPGSSGSTRQSNGESVGRVELLDANCHTIDQVDVSAAGGIRVTFGDSVEPVVTFEDVAAPVSQSAETRDCVRK